MLVNYTIFPDIEIYHVPYNFFVDSKHKVLEYLNDKEYMKTRRLDYAR